MERGIGNPEKFRKEIADLEEKMIYKDYKLIFLDIDGVLNSQDSMMEFGRHSLNDIPAKKHVKVLNRVIKETGAKIVISSTWRRFDSYSTIEMLLYAQGLTSCNRYGTVIGSTPYFSGKPRGSEIKHYLDNASKPSWYNASMKTLIRVENYVIIDDDSDMLPEQFSHFFKCDNKTGLTEEIGQRIINYLK